VHSIVARAAKRSRSCAKCGQPIEVGQSVYRWARKTSYGGITYYQHVACGQPKPSQLYSRKTAQIEDLLQDADFDFTEELSESAQPGDTHEIDTSHVESLLGDIADVAESVGDEYGESADNLPEGLQQGYQAEALRDVAERLRYWADELRSLDFETSFPLRELEEDEDLEDWRDDMQTQIDDAISKIISDAQDLTADMPEYEG
jgi:hypothetical protein